MSAANLSSAGVIAWGETVPEPGPGVYVISLSEDADADAPSSLACPISFPAIQDWLNVRPELRLDGRRPSVPELAARIAAFWVPDEVILYIGLAGTSLRARVRQYVQTPLGARRPHAGGHFLKTLNNLDDLHVHWAPTSQPKEAEHGMLAVFCNGVSDQSRGQVLDPDHPFPFANLEWPQGTRKRHGLTGTKGDLQRADPIGPGRTVREDARAQHTNAGLRVTLHEEVERVLLENGNRWMTTEELARVVNDSSNYRKKDGSPVTPFQIHGRTRNYSTLFERDGARVRLRP
jgi:hypothetical protein